MSYITDMDDEDLIEHTKECLTEVKNRMESILERAEELKDPWRELSKFLRPGDA